MGHRSSRLYFKVIKHNGCSCIQHTEHAQQVKSIEVESQSDHSRELRDKGEKGISASSKKQL